MRRFNSSALRSLGAATAIVVSAGFATSALAANVALSVLNAGPSSDTIPSAAGDRVATVVYPREIKDASVIPTFADINPLSDATDVETTGGTGLRWRSAALFPANSSTNGLGEILVVALADGFDATAADSFILFLNQSDAVGITDLADLQEFIANVGTPGTDYVLYNLDNAALNAGNAFADGDLEEADLDNGIIITQDELDGATPDGGGAVGQYAEFNFAIVVFSEGAFTGANNAVATEWICVDNDGTLVQPEDALFDSGNQIIRILANQQIVDDFDTDNPADTVPGNLSVADFRVLLSDGTTTQTLQAFLNGLNVANSVASVDILDDDDETHRIIEITLNAQVNDQDDIDTILGTRIGFLGADVDSVTGDNQTNSTATYQTMDRGAVIAVDEAQLLQGSGPDFDGNTYEVWVAIDLSEAVADPAAANPAQFQLVADDEDGDETLVAFGVAVQATLPTNADVVGIDDEDGDGTADDNVIEEDSTRVFVQFFLDSGDFRINSDGTVSFEGGFDNDDLENRFPLRLEIDETEVPLLGTEFGTIDSDTSVELGDLARPIPVAALTQSTTDGFCEFIGSIKIVFDEAVTAVDGDQFGLAYDEGETISDLTTGLASNLAIPTIDTAEADDFEDQLLPVANAALTTMYIANDSVEFDAPVIPVEGTANDGSSAILAGTGDTPYLFGINVNAVQGAEGLGNTEYGTFDAADDGDMTAPAETVEDGAPPALLGATGTGSPITDVELGFSEDINNVSGTDEAESLVFFTEDGVRADISDAEIDGIDDNILFIFDLDLDDETEIQVAVFNPGNRIEDDAGNAIDPIVAKTKLVTVTPPAAEFKEEAFAFVDDETNNVTTIVLKTTGQVEIDGTEEELLERFSIRGDDFGDDQGDFGDLVGLVESIEIGTEERADGCFLFILNLVEDCPLTQEDFFVQYNDSDDQPDPDTILVDADNGSEVQSEVIFVNVARPSTPSPEGNPLGETYRGLVDLGGDAEDALGARVSAFVFKSVGSCGTLRFVYKGVVYTGTLGVSDFFLSGTSTIPDGTVVYFHAQLKGDGDECEGNMSPCGIVNSCADIDLYQLAELETQGNGGINSDNGASSITQQVLLYQNLDPSLVVRPIALTLRRDTTTPGRFNVTGAGISNGTLTFDGAFVEIGTTFITGEADENGARPYTLHTRGQKDYLGCPVVFVVCPDPNFSDVEPFLANNLLVRRVTFAADNQGDVTTGARATTFADNAPITFNIDRMFVHPYELDEFVQDNWMFFPVAASNPTRANVSGAGQDFGSAATLPNRVTVPTGTGTATAPFNAVTAFPSNTTARGFFVVLDEDDKEPVLLDMVTALVIDNRGVYCGSVRGLNRISGGHAIAIEFDGTPVGGFSNYTWFAFGTLFEDVSGAALNVAPGTANGGWFILANTTGDDITGSNAASINGNQIFMSMNAEDGVRIFIEGAANEPFNDLEEIGANEGYLLFTDSAFVD